MMPRRPIFEKYWVKLMRIGTLFLDKSKRKNRTIDASRVRTLAISAFVLGEIFL